MKNNTAQFLSLTIPLAAALACAGAAQAQTAGTWMLSAGVTHLTPHVNSDDLTPPGLPGIKVSISNSTQLSGAITYMVTDHLAVDLPLATPFKHDITGDGAISGVGKLGDTKAMPFTVLGQWRFMEPADKFRPYVGLGITYAKFYDEHATSTLSAITGGSPSNPTTLSVASKWAPTLQLGGSYAVNERWFVDGHFTYTNLKTTTRLSTGQTIGIRLNPSTLCVGVGYKF